MDDFACFLQNPEQRCPITCPNFAITKSNTNPKQPIECQHALVRHVMSRNLLQAPPTASSHDHRPQITPGQKRYCLRMMPRSEKKPRWSTTHYSSMFIITNKGSKFNLEHERNNLPHSNGPLSNLEQKPQFLTNRLFGQVIWPGSLIWCSQYKTHARGEVFRICHAVAEEKVRIILVVK